MPLPELIEIIPLDKPVHAEITVPGSKSITNRALILAALAGGETTLQGALWSEDTQVMVEALQKLGFEVKVEQDPQEFCNRTITVKGLGGKIPNAGTADKPLELFVGNAGTAARFLAALVCLGQGVYRLDGTPRMRERPQAALFTALRQLGYRIDAPLENLWGLEKGPGRGAKEAWVCHATHGDSIQADAYTLPAIIHASGPRAGTCRVSIEESSQFASALLLCSMRGTWRIEITGENAEESPYVTLTFKLMAAFPRAGGTWEVEPDASSASYFWAANWLLARIPLGIAEKLVASGKPVSGMLPPVPRFEVARWPTSGWQVDGRFPEFLPLPEVLSREGQLGDSIMTAIVIAVFASHPVRFTDLGRLRLQECERVAALRTELSKCGAEVLEHQDTLTVFPASSPLHGAEIETYNDHRMAMCFAILGLKVPGIKIKNPSCVKKTFPNFFQKLAAPPPHGLGATIRDAKTGRELAVEELFAE